MNDLERVELALRRTVEKHISRPGSSSVTYDELKLILRCLVEEMQDISQAHEVTRDADLLEEYRERGL